MSQCNRRLCGLIPSHQELSEMKMYRKNWVKISENYITKHERKDVPFYYPECLSYKKVQGISVVFNRYHIVIEN